MYIYRCASFIRTLSIWTQPDSLKSFNCQFVNCLSLFIDNVDFQTKKTRDSDYRLTALSVSAEVRALATPAATGVRCGQIGLSVNYNDHA